MIVTSTCLIVFNTPNQVIESMTNSSINAINLLVKLLGIYAIWLGILEIVEQSGLSTKLAKLLSPVVKWLFGNIHPSAKKYITMNLSTNMLGLGNACTPMGINAMKALDAQNKSQTASHQMIMLMIINATSIQLLPTTVIGLRAGFGSMDAANIILPSIIATLVSTCVGILGVKLMIKLTKRKK